GTKQAPATGTKQAPAMGTKQAPAATTTKAAAPATKQAGASGASGASGAQGAAARAQTQTKPGAAAQKTPAHPRAPEAQPKPPVIMREVYEYDAGGRRDPFFSLLTSSDLRPTVADLRLVIVLYDETGRRPVAVMRDIATNTQYRVTTGMTLGRMRVAEIKRKSVIFTIEEFGL